MLTFADVDPDFADSLGLKQMGAIPTRTGQFVPGGRSNYSFYKINHEAFFGYALVGVVIAIGAVYIMSSDGKSK